MAGLAGSDPDSDRQMGFAGAGRSEEDDVLSSQDEVESPEMEEGVSFQAALMVEVELFDGLPCREPGRFDPQFTTVGLAGGDLSFQTGGEELFVAPFLAAGPLRQPFKRLTHRRRL